MFVKCIALACPQIFSPTELFVVSDIQTVSVHNLYVFRNQSTH
jgi:hypothetical protein